MSLYIVEYSNTRNKATKNLQINKLKNFPGRPEEPGINIFLLRYLVRIAVLGLFLEKNQ